MMLTISKSRFFLVFALLAMLLGFATASRAADGTWAVTGSMASGRFAHTATPLANGKVLVAGGYANSGFLASASAELYDPATGTWSATGSMADARVQATATLLANGKVLVAGGANNSGNLASAELYDPATGTWSATGSMARGHYAHTATPLANGKVLVAGGIDAINGNIEYLASAELYDPATGTWSATGSMADARNFHTATPLANGKVLVAGGSNIADSLASAEVYDPATGTWSATGSMTDMRFVHTATLANGKVLVAGGSNYSGYLASAELYDPATGTWSATGSLASGRYSHTATPLANGKVLVAAGYANSGNLASAELYDPATDTWSVTGSMAVARFRSTDTLLADGKVLVAGGYANSGNLASAEVYTPPNTRPPYQFGGFYQPVDNVPALNTDKAGQAIPVKFTLYGNFGLDIFDPGYPKSVAMNCSSAALLDDIEETVTAGGSSLTYAAGSNQYHYVWKTDKAWTGQCRQLIVRLNDGTDHVANFKFK